MKEPKLVLEKIREIDWTRFWPGSLVLIDMDHGPDYGYETHRGLVVHVSKEGSLWPQIIVTYFHAGCIQYYIFNNYSNYEVRPLIT